MRGVRTEDSLPESAVGWGLLSRGSVRRGASSQSRPLRTCPLRARWLPCTAPGGLGPIYTHTHPLLSCIKAFISTFICCGKYKHNTALHTVSFGPRDNFVWPAASKPLQAFLTIPYSCQFRVDTNIW